MKILASVLLVAGTIVGTLGGARLPTADVLASALGVAMLAAGAVLFRLADRKQRAAAARGEVAAGDPATIALEALRLLPDRVDEVAKQAPTIGLEAIVERIAAIERELLRPIADGSPRLLGLLGAGRFAEVLGAYASGERLVYRAWSAAADGHRPEALDALALGAERIRRAVAGIEVRKGS